MPFPHLSLAPLRRKRFSSHCHGHSRPGPAPPAFAPCSARSCVPPGTRSVGGSAVADGGGLLQLVEVLLPQSAGGSNGLALARHSPALPEIPPGSHWPPRAIRTGCSRR